MLQKFSGQHRVIAFLETIAHPQITLECVSKADIQRATEIMEQYHDANLDFVDCCIMAQTERLNISSVCTFDRRDFSLFRPRHCDYLELLP